MSRRAPKRQQLLEGDTLAEASGERARKRSRRGGAGAGEDAGQPSPPEVLGFMLAQQQGLYCRHQRRPVLLRSLRFAAPRRAGPWARARRPRVSTRAFPSARRSYMRDAWRRRHRKPQFLAIHFNGLSRRVGDAEGAAVELPDVVLVSASLVVQAWRDGEGEESRDEKSMGYMVVESKCCASAWRGGRRGAWDWVWRLPSARSSHGCPL